MHPQKDVMNIRLHNLSGRLEPNFGGRGTAGASADELILPWYHDLDNLKNATIVFKVRNISYLIFMPRFVGAGFSKTCVFSQGLIRLLWTRNDLLNLFR